MTQELNKDALDAAISHYLEEWGLVSKKGLAGAIQAYHNHPKVTGFESRIAALKVGYARKHHTTLHKLLDDMQATLAGGNTK